MDGETGAVAVEVTVAAPVADVWTSLREPTEIRRWHGWLHAGFDKEVRRTYLEGATIDDGHHTLLTGDGERLELRPDGTETRVLLTLPDRSDAEGSVERWMISLQQLRFVHEVRPERTRRSVSFLGRGEPEALPRLLHTVPADVGATWYREGHQQGVVLPDLGPGLLITTGSPSVVGADGRASVEASAVVTMYGVLDGEFGFQRDIWSAWWRAAYPAAADPQF